MPFLGPWFLMGILGAVGVAIPIVLHFLFRSRYRTVFWGAMEFLLASIEQTSRRLKFQELLLLILRCAVLFFLALALARPAFSLVGGGSGRDAVDAFLVIDNSFSMGGREGAKSRFDLAKTAALEIIDQLPPHSTVQMFACGMGVSEPLLREPANLDQARRVIERLELTHQATDLGPGVVQAVELLKYSKAANKELYVISDMQKQGLSTSAGKIQSALDQARLSASVYFVRTGTHPLTTAAIVDVAPQSGIPRPGHRVVFAVAVRNTGSAVLRQLQVGLAVDGVTEGAETQTIAELAQGETRVVSLTVRFEKPGQRVVTAFLGNDDLPGDNYLDRVIEVREKVKVLIVDGSLNARDPERSSSFYLEGALQALSPASDPKKTDLYMSTDVVTPRQAGGELLRDKSICILVNVPLASDLGGEADVPTSEFTDSLADFVRNGGGLLIYGGEKVKSEAYNKVFGGTGLLPAELTPTETYPIKSGTALDPLSAGLTAFDHFRTDKIYARLEGFVVLKSLGQRESSSKSPGAVGGSDKGVARVVMRYNNGKPAIVSRKVGFGEVMVVGTSADPGYEPRSHDRLWNWLTPQCPYYYPLVEGKVNFLLNAQSQTRNFTVGEPLRYVPPDEFAQRSFMLIEPGPRTHASVSLLPEGLRVPLGLAKKEQDRHLVVTPGLVRAGVYWLTTREGAGDERQPFAVAADLRESADLQTLSDAEIDRQLGFTPMHVTVKEGEPALLDSERSNREWTGWLLWLVLAIALSESLLAWFCGRAW